MRHTMTSQDSARIDVHSNKKATPDETQYCSLVLRSLEWSGESFEVGHVSCIISERSEDVMVTCDVKSVTIRTDRLCVRRCKRMSYGPVTTETGARARCPRRPSGRAEMTALALVHPTSRAISRS